MIRISHAFGIAALLALGAVLPPSVRSAPPQEAPADASAMKPYTETIPGTDVKFEMVPIPGGTYLMGSPETEENREDERGRSTRSRSRRSGWASTRSPGTSTTSSRFALDMKKKQREKVDLARQPETEKKADAVTRPTPPYADETFGFGRKGQPVICITHHAAMEYCRWLSEPRPARSTACPPRPSGNTPAAPAPRRPTPSATTRRSSTSTPGTSRTPRSRSRSARRSPTLGPLRHPRQRRRVVPGPLRSPTSTRQFADRQADCRAGGLARLPRSTPTSPAAGRGTTTPTGSAAPRGERRTRNGASRTRSAPRASGGTPTRPSSASGSSGPSNEQENLKGLKSLVVKGKGTR